MKLRNFIAFVTFVALAVVLSHAPIQPKFNWVFVDGGAFLGVMYVVYLQWSVAYEKGKELESAFGSHMQELLKEFEKVNTAAAAQKPSEKPQTEHVVSLDDK